MPSMAQPTYPGTNYRISRVIVVQTVNKKKRSIVSSDDVELVALFTSSVASRQCMVRQENAFKSLGMVCRRRYIYYTSYLVYII